MFYIGAGLAAAFYSTVQLYENNKGMIMLSPFKEYTLHFVVTGIFWPLAVAMEIERFYNGE